MGVHLDGGWSLQGDHFVSREMSKAEAKQEKVLLQTLGIEFEKTEQGGKYKVSIPHNFVGTAIPPDFVDKVLVAMQSMKANSVMMDPETIKETMRQRLTSAKETKEPLQPPSSLDRKGSEEALADKPDGSWILRNSSQGGIVVSFKKNGIVDHILDAATSFNDINGDKRAHFEKYLQNKGLNNRVG